jgi:multicomponent Na+:H+ antiporter subunit E
MRTIPLKQTLRLSLTLGLVWLLLSGYFHNLMLFFGLCSVVIVVIINKRMYEVDGDNYTMHLTVDVLKYMVQLWQRILVSNIDVTLRILGFKRTQSQFVKLPLRFKDDFSKVLYANAITLTPGSASITMTEDTLLVHTISNSGAKDLLDGDMEGIIPKIEKTAFIEEKHS